jgi:hypothetical protein
MRPRELRPHNEGDSRDRLSKAVTRLALDRKIKSALNLIDHESQGADIDFDLKLHRLKAKFIDKTGDIDPIIPTSTTPFSGLQVINAIEKMPRDAATCIDGWTKDLLSQAVAGNPPVADLLGTLLAYVNDSQFGANVMKILRMGRLVGIPKPDGGIRPITVSSTIVKLLGIMVMKRAQTQCSKMQFAINVKDGAIRVTHLAREQFDHGDVVIRIDSSNAFNVAQRHRIRTLLEHQDADILRYFDTMYSQSTTLAVFGPDGRIEYVEANEGVKQGDAFSAYFFCLLMDEV